MKISGARQGILVGAGMHEEIELKLAIAPEHMERLRRHPVLRALQQKRASTKRLVSTYYDTPAFELRRKAVALRVRKVGDERIQTIKREAASGRSRIARREWEKRIEGDQPDLSALDDPVLRRLVGPYGRKGALKPVFVTDIKRVVLPLRVGTSEIECVLDVGEITADEKSAAVCEVELELKSGPSARLFELARRLNKAVPLRFEPASKAARGYSLVTGAGSAPRKAQSVGLDPGMTVRDAFAAIARACVGHIVANVDCAHRGVNPEGVHQLRVGIRRLRAAFSVFRDAFSGPDRAALSGELRWLQQELGPAREWDVFIDSTLRIVARRIGDSPGLDALARAAEVERRGAYEKARASINERRFTDLLLRLEGWLDRGLGGRPRRIAGEAGGGADGGGADADPLERPIRAFAAEILQERHAKVQKLGEKIRRFDKAQLHEFRIRVKKLRYATEFFRALYGDKATRRHIAALKELQEVLGAAHDALVAEELVVRLETVAGAGAERAAGQLQGWCAAHFKHDRRSLENLWQGFGRLKPFWKGA